MTVTCLDFRLYYKELNVIHYILPNLYIKIAPLPNDFVTCQNPFYKLISSHLLF